MKYLIWLVVALAVVVWLKRLKKTFIANRQQGPQASSQGQARERANPGEGERMVQCAHCGIHFPASEAVSNLSGTVFCSVEHRSLSSS